MNHADRSSTASVPRRLPEPAGAGPAADRPDRAGDHRVRSRRRGRCPRALPRSREVTVRLDQRPVSKNLFEELATDEEGHIDFLETQLELIRQIGACRSTPSATSAAGADRPPRPSSRGHAAAAVCSAAAVPSGQAALQAVAQAAWVSPAERCRMPGSCGRSGARISGCSRGRHRPGRGFADSRGPGAGTHGLGRRQDRCRADDHAECRAPPPGAENQPSGLVAVP